MLPLRKAEDEGKLLCDLNEGLWQAAEFSLLLLWPIDEP